MNGRETYDGWYKLGDEEVHVWPVESPLQNDHAAPRVTKLPEVGPAGMMRGVYAPRDLRDFLADRDLACSGGCVNLIQAGERFRFVGKSYRFRRPICLNCFAERRFPDVWMEWGYTPEPDYSGKDMPDTFYRYGRRRGGLRADGRWRMNL